MCFFSILRLFRGRVETCRVFLALFVSMRSDGEVWEKGGEDPPSSSNARDPLLVSEGFY